MSECDTIVCDGQPPDHLVRVIGFLDSLWIFAVSWPHIAATLRFYSRKTWRDIMAMYEAKLPQNSWGVSQIIYAFMLHLRWSYFLWRRLITRRSNYRTQLYRILTQILTNILRVQNTMITLNTVLWGKFVNICVRMWHNSVRSVHLDRVIGLLDKNYNSLECSRSAESVWEDDCGVLL